MSSTNNLDSLNPNCYALINEIQKNLGLFLVFILLLITIPLTVWSVKNLRFETRKKATNQKPLIQTLKPEYVESEVIVKLKAPLINIKNKAGVAVEAELDKQPIPLETMDQKTLPPVLNTINQRYEIETIDKVFKGAKSPKKEIAKFQRSPIDSEKFLKVDTSRTYKISYKQKVSPQQVIQELKINPEIEYIEPNYLAYASYIPNDPFYSQQWAHQKTQAEQEWEIERGNKNTIIAIIDTGVNYNHEDLRANLLADCTGGCPAGTGYDFVNINPSDYEALGFILIPEEDYTGEDNNPADYHGHGTHCAGIAAGVGNNGTGISGVCPNCSLLPIRAGFSIKLPNDIEVGLFEDVAVAASIRYAAQNGAKIVSMSFGGEGVSQTVKDALDFASSLGVNLIAAAGNNNSEHMTYPAAFENVISVVATDTQDQKANFSSYGYWTTIAAPGVDILSTVPKIGSLNDPSGYRNLSGTSMAAPYVAGVVGLILSKQTYTPAEIKQVLQQTVDPVNSRQYIYMGSGRINIFKALNFDPVDTIAKIDSPESGSIVMKNNVEIIGTATGDTYTISYGSGAYPISWTNINSGLTVNRDILANWNIQELNSGYYTLRLTVIKNGRELIETAFIRINKTQEHSEIPLNENVIISDTQSMSVAPSGKTNDFGNLYVVWGKSRADYKSDIYMSTSLDQGATFSPDLLISTGEDSNKYSYFPSIDIKGDNVFVVYESNDEYSYPINTEDKIVLKRSINEGSSFEIRNTISIPGMTSPNLAGRFMEVKTSISQDYLYLVWQASQILDNKTYVYFARYNLTKNLFEETKIIRTISHNPNRIPPEPHIINDNSGNIYVLWAEKPIDNLYRLFLAKSTNQGNTFNSPQIIFNSEDYEDQYYPQIAYDSKAEIIYITWAASGQFGSRDVWISRSIDRGLSFSAPFNITQGNWLNPLYTIQRPSPVTSNSFGQVFVSWRETATGNIYLWQSDSSFTQISGPTLIFSIYPPFNYGFQINLVSGKDQNIFTIYDFEIPHGQGIFQIFSRRTNFTPLTLTPPPITSTPSLTSTPTPSCLDKEKGNLDCDSRGLINEIDLTILLSRWGEANLPTIDTLTQNWKTQ